jgi:hypothetical protein
MSYKEIEKLKFESNGKGIDKLCDYIEIMADKIDEIVEALNAEKAHCTDDPLECPALKRFADAEKTGKFTCACCGVELLPQGEWSLCFNCEKMNADRLHPEAEKAERCPEQKCPLCGDNWHRGECKPRPQGKLSTSGEDDLVLLIVKEMYGIPYSKLAIGEAEKCKKLAHAIMQHIDNGK